MSALTIVAMKVFKVDTAHVSNGVRARRSAVAKLLLVASTVLAGAPTIVYAQDATSSTAGSLAAQVYMPEEVEDTSLYCDPSHYFDFDANACVECVFGTWSNGRMEVCEYPVSCDVGSMPSLHATNATDCISCLAGFYSDIFGTDMCKPCHCDPGFASAANAAVDGASTCKACPPATHALGGSDQCRNCPANTYAGEASAKCLPLECPPGSAPNEQAVSATDCSECPAGFFSPGGVAACEPLECHAGHFAHAGAANNSDCFECAFGTYSAGGLNVTECEEVKCPAGTVTKRGAVNATNCDVCAVGTVSPGGSNVTECVECPLGQYASTLREEDLGASLCAPATCPAGSVAPPGAVSAAADCIECEFGLFSPGNDTASCEIMDCPPGSQPNSPAASATDCQVCVLGWFSPGGASACEPTECPVGTEPTYNATDAEADCQACPYGTSSSGNASMCQYPTCEPGYEPDALGSECVQCPAGSFSTGTSASTKVHDLGMHLGSSTVNLFCSPTECAPGSEAFEGATHPTDDCVTRNVTSFSLGGNMSCASCGNGTYASEKHDKCLPMVCPAGSEPKWAPISGDDCEICQQGYFSPGGATMCAPVQCARGYSALAGATHETRDCLFCPQGQYSLGGMSVCQDTTCKPGYSAGAGAHGPKKDCEPCGAGFWSIGNATKCLAMQCEPGYSSQVPAAIDATSSCAICPQGTFSHGGKGQCEPVQCPPGQFSVEGASDSVSSCIDCPAGHTSLGNETLCEPCARGLYAKAGDQVCSPAQCEAGWQANELAANATDCTGCEIGL